MSEYIVVDGELYHYGIKGMKWGINRATRKLEKASESGNAAEYNEAIEDLEEHKEKGTKKLSKLQEKHDKIEKQLEKQIEKNGSKAAKMLRDAEYLRMKSKTVAKWRSENILQKASIKEQRANMMLAEIEEGRSKLLKNEKSQKLFKEQLDKIDKALTEKGRKYIDG